MHGWELKDFIENIDYSTVIKWVIIVLIAGFIGQFGKQFANYIVEKFGSRKKKDEPVVIQAPVQERDTMTPPVPTPAEAAREIPVVEKEERNFEAERAKEESKAKKKLDKALAKQKKKETKRLKEEA